MIGWSMKRRGDGAHVPLCAVGGVLPSWSAAATQLRIGAPDSPLGAALFMNVVCQKADEDPRPVSRLTWDTVLGLVLLPATREGYHKSIVLTGSGFG